MTIFEVLNFDFSKFKQISSPIFTKILSSLSLKLPKMTFLDHLKSPKFAIMLNQSSNKIIKFQQSQALTQFLEHSDMVFFLFQKLTLLVIPMMFPSLLQILILREVTFAITVFSSILEDNLLGMRQITIHQITLLLNTLEPTMILIYQN